MATAFDREVRGPSMQAVIEILTLNGIQVESKKMQVCPSYIRTVYLCQPAAVVKDIPHLNFNLILKANDVMPNQVSDWIKSQSRPVVILHHETPTAAHYIQRELSNSTVTPLNEFQISQYQVQALLIIPPFFKGRAIRNEINTPLYY